MALWLEPHSAGVSSGPARREGQIRIHHVSAGVYVFWAQFTHPVYKSLPEASSLARFLPLPVIGCVQKKTCQYLDVITQIVLHGVCRKRRRRQQLCPRSSGSSRTEFSRRRPRQTSPKPRLKLLGWRVTRRRNPRRRAQTARYACPALLLLFAHQPFFPFLSTCIPPLRPNTFKLSI